MIYEWNEDVGKVCIIGENTEEVPMWVINHYFKTFCDNYVKIILLTRLCELYQNGVRSDRIFISKKSIPVLSQKRDIEKFMYNNDDVIDYFVKKDTPKKFWDMFNRCARPMIYYREKGHGLIPLYEYKSDVAVKICYVSYNSPIEYIVKGAIDVLTDLTINNARYRHEEEEHAARQISNLANGYTSIVRAYQVIDDPRTPEGVKRYASDALATLLEKQNKLNENLGIKLDNIDTRL